LRKKTQLALVGLLLVLGGLGVAASVVARQQMPDPEEMVRLWAEYSTPGERHDELGRLVGEWEYAMQVVMPGAAESAPTPGVAVCEWGVPERVVECNAEGEFMGEPHHRHTLWGFDKFKKKYVAVFSDTSSTAINTAEGVVVDPTGRVLVLYGTLDEFLTGEHDKPVRYVLRWIDGDHYEMDVWDLGIGERGEVVIHMEYARSTEGGPDEE